MKILDSSLVKLDMSLYMVSLWSCLSWNGCLASQEELSIYGSITSSEFCLPLSHKIDIKQLHSFIDYSATW